MRARFWPDGNVISGAFRCDDSGLDSGLKQGDRCVNEHAYEQTVSYLTVEEHAIQ